MIVSERPIITVACDEPMSDFVGAVLREIADITGKPRRRSEIDNFDIAGSLALSPEDSAELWHRVGQEKFCLKLYPIEGAYDGICALREFADVRAVTSPFKSPHWANERERWLMKQMGFKRDEIIQTPGKDVVFAHVFIDDKIEPLFKWRDRWPGSHAIRFTAPWNDNRGWDGHSSCDWTEIVKLARVLVGR